ncbi:MAG: family 16 glycosylhydrolase [Saprospiraceae bacterium]|nr:family 16 glycosylhydrolase [Saprospiraceae bacterium]
MDVKQQAGTWFEFNKKYTSGMIQSIQSFNTYTKYEVKCKISSGTGYWPAFWTFGGNTEIDVFEFYEEADRFECSVHYWDNYYPHFLGIDWPNWLEDLNIPQFHEFIDPGMDMSQDFHVYAVEYDKFFVNFYLDGIKKVTMPRYFNLNGSPVTSCNVPAGPYIQHPEFPKFGNPLNVIANVALFDEPADQLSIIPQNHGD